MYRAYDHYLWARAAEPEPPCSPLDIARLDPRTLVHPLVLCPPLPQGVRYLLVQRRLGGQRVIKGFGRARSLHPTLNLAEVRQTAARLGAGEVYLLPS